MQDKVFQWALRVSKQIEGGSAFWWELRVRKTLCVDLEYGRMYGETCEI